MCWCLISRTLVLFSFVSVSLSLISMKTLCEMFTNCLYFCCKVNLGIPKNYAVLTIYLLRALKTDSFCLGSVNNNQLKSFSSFKAYSTLFAVDITLSGYVPVKHKLTMPPYAMFFISNSQNVINISVKYKRFQNAVLRYVSGNVLCGRNGRFV